MTRIGLRLIAVLAVVAVAAAFGAGLQPEPAAASGHTPDPAARRIIIDVGEYFFRVRGQPPGAPLVLTAGERTEIVFWNEGRMLHEVYFGRDVVMEAGRPDGYAIQLFDGVEVEVLGRMAGRYFKIEAGSLLEIYLHPRQRLRVFFTMPAEKRGTWEMGCFLPGHYEAGQRHWITVR
jgi:uncharacterized cupredoxin-like copper-binding protein